MTQRVLCVSTSLRTRGGIASYVRLLQETELWPRWRMRHVATHRDGSAAVKIAVFATALVRYVGELLLRRPDLVHLHMSAHGSFVRKALMAALARALRVPVLVHVHGSEFDTFHARLPPSLRRVVRATLESAAAVVALGDLWAARLQDIAPRARVVTIPNAVRLPPVVRPADGGPLQVVFLGEIGERKGAFTLIASWAKLATDPAVLGDARLLLAGDRQVERARAMVAEHGIADSVTVRGWLTPVEVAELLNRADVLVLPSRSEGQPMAVLEAMAHGVAVIAGNSGGIPEMIENGRSGLLVPPGDVDALCAALRLLATDGPLRRSLAVAGRERVRAEFDLDVVWRRFDALYREVTGR